jgi:hypothetical protein
MNMMKLHGKPIKVNKASQDKKALDVGANIFVGNLDPDVDEKLLYDTFTAFGGITQTPKIMRDPDTGNSKYVDALSSCCLSSNCPFSEGMDSFHSTTSKLLILQSSA